MERPSGAETGEGCFGLCYGGKGRGRGRGEGALSTEDEDYCLPSTGQYTPLLLGEVPVNTGSLSSEGPVMDESKKKKKK